LIEILDFCGTNGLLYPFSQDLNDIDSLIIINGNTSLLSLEYSWWSSWYL